MNELLEMLIESAANGTDEDFDTLMTYAESIMVNMASDESAKNHLKNELAGKEEEQINAVKEMLKYIEENPAIEGLTKERSDRIIAFIKVSSFQTLALIDEIQNGIKILFSTCRDREDIPMPTYAHDGDSGMDVYALEDYDIAPGETVLIPTGLKVVIPQGYELQVRPKSGRALKTKLRVANTPGTIDSTYRDEIGIIIENIESPIQDIEYEFDEGEIKILSILHGKPYVIEKGTKFAQLVLTKVEKGYWSAVDEVDEFTSLREGGFGSTGLN